jgi:hypothetical protein
MRHVSFPICGGWPTASVANIRAKQRRDLSANHGLFNLKDLWQNRCHAFLASQDRLGFKQAGSVK